AFVNYFPAEWVLESAIALVFLGWVRFALPVVDIPCGSVVRVQGPRKWIRFQRDVITAAELRAAVARITPIIDVAVEEPEIEVVIAELSADPPNGVPGRPGHVVEMSPRRTRPGPLVAERGDVDRDR
ncbi:MAG TPA: hypothetical protein VHU17_02975, partial [Acidimicrobiales bacterium]|nr:hypothetical protein [Acidimicrobiales bacterium]